MNFYSIVLGCIGSGILIFLAVLLGTISRTFFCVRAKLTKKSAPNVKKVLAQSFQGGWCASARFTFWEGFSFLGYFMFKNVKTGNML